MLDFTNYFIENTRKLNEQQRHLLLVMLERGVPELIDKYVAGALEHGGLLTELDCLKEGYKESTDGWFYGLAGIIKRENETNKKLENI